MIKSLATILFYIYINIRFIVAFLGVLAGIWYLHAVFLACCEDCYTVDWIDRKNHCCRKEYLTKFGAYFKLFRLRLTFALTFRWNLMELVEVEEPHA